MKKDIIIVDQNDNVIGSKPRDLVDYEKDIYRVSSLWLTNSKGEILIAQRKHTKKHDPNKWSGAVAGTVEVDETYESNIYREAEEEIGLKGCKFKLGPKQFVSHSKKFFVQWYFCISDKSEDDFVIQDEELEKVKWIGTEDLINDVKNNPQNYIESMPSIIKLLVVPL